MSTTAEPRRAPAHVRRRRILWQIANHALLIAVALAFAIPVIFMLLTAVMTDQQALSARI